MKDDTIKHPGTTDAQRRVLDQIGVGNCSPMMAPRKKLALLRKGLIVEAGVSTLGSGVMAVRIAEYMMPISVHMQWVRGYV